MVNLSLYSLQGFCQYILNDFFPDKTVSEEPAQSLDQSFIAEIEPLAENDLLESPKDSERQNREERDREKEKVDRERELKETKEKDLKERERDRLFRERDRDKDRERDRDEEKRTVSSAVKDVS